MQTFCRWHSNADIAQVLLYYELYDGTHVLGYESDTVLSGTGEEDVVVDSAISVDNVFGEMRKQQYSIRVL